MKVKNRNLIELILQALTLILAFIPGFYKLEEWVDDLEYSPNLHTFIPIKTLRFRNLYSLFNGLFDSSTIVMIIGMVLCATIVCGIVLYALQFVAKDNKRNWKPTLIISCIEIILFIVCSILIETNDWTYLDFEYRYSLQIMFWVILCVFVALVAISIVGYIKAAKKGIIEETPKIYKTEIVKNSSNADELRKYKQLLDDGIITQEEFDAKKKQLLGL